ncbi:unnamed protein product [Clavelina lepadiformis]|uniref:EGF-like domain-containing protein n=1 Tax=Clavelina lepadiformis TaxID=159417 RepID=A0ABP0GKU1_CLALP
MRKLVWAVVLGVGFLTFGAYETLAQLNLDSDTLTQFILLSLIRRPSQRPSQTRRCSGNQVFSQCAGCIVNCKDRFDPNPCRNICQPRCTCPSGTFWSGNRCVVSSECPGKGVDCNCSPFATCSNDGSGNPVCSCDEGYSGDGKTCVRATQCGCHPFATCTVTEGNTEVCTCGFGYSGDGRIDCAPIPFTPNFFDCECSRNAACTRDENFFPICSCNAGFVGDGITCEPVVNPAPISPCNFCSIAATCIETSNGLACSCNEGFIGDGISCTPTIPENVVVNESSTRNTCDPPCSSAGQCTPSSSGQHFCRCVLGYTGDDCSIVPNFLASQCKPPCSNDQVCSIIGTVFGCV